MSYFEQRAHSRLCWSVENRSVIPLPSMTIVEGHPCLLNMHMIFDLKRWCFKAGLERAHRSLGDCIQRFWWVLWYLWPILSDRAAITSVPPLAQPSRTSVMLPWPWGRSPPLIVTRIIPTRTDWTTTRLDSYNNWKDTTYIHTEVWHQHSDYSSHISTYKH